MFVRLGRYLYATLAALAMWAVVLAIMPGAAGAQGTAPGYSRDDLGAAAAPSIGTTTSAYGGAKGVVVSPGDSLWSISAERLGPSATPPRVADGVARIYELNRERIGADPGVLFPGQELLVPTMGKASAAEPSATAGSPTARGAAEPAAQAGPTARVDRSGTDGAPRTTADGEEVGEAPEPSAVAAPLSDAGAKPTAPNDPPRSSPVEPVATPRSAFSSAASTLVGALPEEGYPRRRMLGWAILALTLVVGSLMAWKLPMNRSIARGAEAWPSYAAAAVARRSGRYDFRPGIVESHHAGGTPGSAALGPESPVPGSEGEETATQKSAERVAIVGAARGRRDRIRSGLARRLKRIPRGGLANGAHSPEVRRRLRAVRGGGRARKTPNGRPQAARRVARGRAANGVEA